MKWMMPILTLFLVLFLSSCGSNKKSKTHQLEEPAGLVDIPTINDKQYFRVLSPEVCTQENKNRFIYQAMHDSYLWSEEVPELDYEDMSKYNSSQKLLDALRSPHDHFSFLMDLDMARSYYEEGKDDDFGFHGYIKETRLGQLLLVVSFVYPSSPAEMAGIQRGDIISLLNGQKISPQNIELFAREDSIAFTIVDAEGRSTVKKITKTAYEVNPILYSTHFEDIAGKHVGYMVFNDFIDTAISRLDTLFDGYKRLEIDELVLDLRYNGGGSDIITNHLASLIAGTKVVDTLFNKVSFNERYSSLNERQYFEPIPKSSLNLNRVFILTSGATCSASELLINALRASSNEIEVIQIGGSTCGKPYGYYGYGTLCDKAFHIINMETKNGDNVGGYVNGLTPTCMAEDNSSIGFGEKEENLLKEALNYIEKDRCEHKYLSYQEKEKRPKQDEMVPPLQKW